MLVGHPASERKKGTFQEKSWLRKDGSLKLPAS